MRIECLPWSITHSCKSYKNKATKYLTRSAIFISHDKLYQLLSLFIDFVLHYFLRMMWYWFGVQHIITTKFKILINFIYFIRCILQQERPYNHDSTASRPLSEVKHDLARLVLRSGTTLESLVLIFFHPPQTTHVFVVKKWKVKSGKWWWKIRNDHNCCK